MFFSWLSWDTYCSEHQKNPAFKKTVAAAEASKGDADTSVKSLMIARVEISTSAVVLSESELLKELGLARLPPHMRSIPTLEVPCVHSSDMSAAAAEKTTETVYCFRDEQQPHRVAKLIYATGADASTVTMKAEFYRGQKVAMLNYGFRELAGADSLKLGRDPYKKLVPLSDFVAEKTKKQMARASAKLHAAPHTDKALGSACDGSDEESSSSDESGCKQNTSNNENESEDVWCSGCDSESSGDATQGEKPRGRPSGKAGGRAKKARTERVSSGSSDAGADGEDAECIAIQSEQDGDA